MILGDSLLVMTSLAEKEGLKGQVQTIYIDPPYGIKFGSNWQVSTRKRDVTDGKDSDLTRQPEQIRAYRDTWAIGIHSYLAYLRDRLTVARDLLTATGSVFVQIGDANVHLVRSLLDEVFGSSNIIAEITFRKTAGGTGEFLPGVVDYLLWYAREADLVKFRQPWISAPLEDRTGYRWVKLSDRSYRGMTAAEAGGTASLPTGARIYKPDNITSQSQGAPRARARHRGSRSRSVIGSSPRR
jgi:adenine-specific DNA-methyltransferase